MSDLSNNQIEYSVFPEEWDALLKIMPYEVLSKMNGSLMDMNRTQQIEFMNKFITESKKELGKQGLNTNFENVLNNSD